MEKFLNIPVHDLVVNGTSDSGAPANSLKDAAVNFTTSGVQVGDIVHQSTDNKYFVVDVVTSATELQLSALDGGTLPIPNGKAYFIHSGTASTGVLVSSVNVGLVEQASTSTTTIAYDTPATNVDLITLTHTPVAAGSEVARDTVEEEIVKSLQTKWNEPSYNKIGEALILADNIKVIGIALS